MRVHSILACSEANGPGKRGVVWVQGCKAACPGCHNPKTHPYEGGREMEVVDILEAFDKGIEGITVSGGEPFDDLFDLRRLLKRAQINYLLSTLVFTGYTPSELLGQGECTLDALQHIDILVAGRYDQTQKCDEPLLASRNQEVLFLSDRYSQADLVGLPRSEFHIDLNSGASVRTGF